MCRWPKPCRRRRPSIPTAPPYEPRAASASALVTEMFPASPFWDFSLRLYARPRVADSCLALQERHGIDVNLLFCCLWLGIEGQQLAKRDISRLAARVRTLHENVVKPLRQARTVLKGVLASEDESLRPVLGTLRTAIKKS